MWRSSLSLVLGGEEGWGVEEHQGEGEGEDTPRGGREVGQGTPQN